MSAAQYEKFLAKHGFSGLSSLKAVPAEIFVRGWMENYKKGLTAICSVLNMNQDAVKARYKTMAANGVVLPKCYVHRLDGQASANRLNEIVNEYLSKDLADAEASGSADNNDMFAKDIFADLPINIDLSSNNDLEESEKTTVSVS